MIHIHKHDSIPDIILKIRKDSSKSLLLVFPFWHSLLHNTTALKILVKNAEGRDICIKTSDITAKEIGQKIGIQYKMTHVPETDHRQMSISQYIQNSSRAYIDELLSLFQHRGKNTHKQMTSESSKIGHFILYFGITIALFLFIFYFAVSKTYIYITPEISIKNKWKNLVFRELPDDEISKDIHVVKVKKISKKIFLEDIFPVQWVEKESAERSKWTVTIYNHTPVPIPLLVNSRLETINSEAIFTIPRQITLPPATSSGSDIIPGTIDTDVIASIYNTSWNIVGAKGNISDQSLMVFPWLWSNRDKIYARALWDFNGWNDTIVKQITREDIKMAKKRIEEAIKKQALKELEKEIEIQNQTNNITYSVINSDGLVEYSDIKIRWEELIAIGEVSDEFKLSATIEVSSYVYNKELVLSRLKNFIKDNTLEDIESILHINEDSLRVSEVIYKRSSPFELKATTQVEVFYVYNFLNRQNNYLDNFKSSIAGLPKSEAVKILLNNPKIRDVQIETRPFFVKNVSGIQNNIVFKVED